MPKIYKEQAQTSAIGPSFGVPEPNANEEPDLDPTLLQTFGAAFKLDNSFASLWSREGGQGRFYHGINMEFDADEFVPEDLTKAGYNSRYIYAQDESQVHAITTQIRREQKDRETLASSGGWGIAASIAAGVLDPINLIPVGGAAVKATRAGKNFLQVGKSTAMAGLVSTSAAEAALHATQRTRTKTESVANIAMGTALSGILGAGVGAFVDLKAQGLFDKSFDDIADELGVALSVPQEPLVPAPKLTTKQQLESTTASPASVGAAQTPDAQLMPAMESMKLATSAGYKEVFNIDVGKLLSKLPVFGREKATIDYFNTPQLRNFNSDDQHILWAQWRLTGSPLLAQGHLDGSFKAPRNVANNIATAQAEFIVPIDNALKQAKKEYKKLSKSGEVEKITESDFEDRVYLAAKYNRDTGIKPIDDAKKVMLDQFAVYTEKLKKLGYDVDDGYIPQQMNPMAIRTGEHGFMRIMREKVEREIQRAGQKVFSVDKTVQQIKDNIKTSRSEMVRRANAAHKAAYKEVLDTTQKELEALFTIDDFKKLLIAKAEKDAAEPSAPPNVEKMVHDAVSRAIRKAYNHHAKEQLNKLNDSINKDFKNKLSDLDDAGEAGLAVDDIIKETDPQIGAEIGGLDIDLKKLEAAATAKILEKLKKAQGKRKTLLDLDEDALNKFVAMKFNNFILGKSKKAANKAAKQARKEIESEFGFKIKDLKDKLKKEQSKAYKLRLKSEEGVSDIDAYLQNLIERMNGLTRADDMAVALDGLKAPVGYIGSAGNLRKRMIDWTEDEDLLTDLVQGGYMESQPSRIAQIYSGTVIPDLEMSAMFGDVTGAKLIKEIKDAQSHKFVEMEEAIAAQKDPKIKAKLNKGLRKEREKQKRHLSDLQVQIDRMTGRFHTDAGYSSWREFASTLKGFNIISVGGNFVRGSMPDLPRIMLTEASLPIYRDTIAKLPKQLITGKSREQSIEAANTFATALNFVLPGRAAAVSDMADQYTAGARSSFSQKMGSAVDKYFAAIGFHWWNDTMQSTVGRATYSTLIERLKKARSGTASQWERTQLLAGGIDPADATRILKTIEKANVQEGALHRLNTEKIDFNDPDQLDAFRAVQHHVKREVDTLIVTPGQDVPVVSSTTAGSIALQFQSFGYASQERSFLYYLQKFRYSPNKLGIALAATSQLSMAGVVAYLSMWGAGKAAETAEWTAQKWMLEMVDRSGMAGSMMNQYNTVTSALGAPQNVFASSLADAAGVDLDLQPTTRMMHKGVLTRIGGPTAGAIVGVGGAGSGLAHFITGQGVTKNEAKAGLRLAPSVPFLTDALRTGVNESDLLNDRKYKRKKSKRSVLYID